MLSETQGNGMGAEAVSASARDRRQHEADIHVLITTQSTGSGGTEYTMAFIGQRDYEDYQNTLRFVSGSTDTPDEVRQGYVKVLKMGLVAVGVLVQKH